jgi:hypothetical protein
MLAWSSPRRYRWPIIGRALGIEKRPAIGGSERCESRKNAAKMGNNNENAHSHSHSQDPSSSGMSHEVDKKEYILGVVSFLLF